MERFFRILSVIFHPLFLPFYAMSVLLEYSSIGLILPYKSKAFLLVLTFLGTSVIPFLFIVFLRIVGFCSSLSLRRRKERILPLLFGAAVCYFCFHFLEKVPFLPFGISDIFWMLCLFLVLLACITHFWKISLHLAGIGGLLAIVFSIANSLWLFLACVFVSGLMGTARLYLQAHNSSQVYIGFFVGLFFFFVCFSFIF